MTLLVKRCTQWQAVYVHFDRSYSVAKQNEVRRCLYVMLRDVMRPNGTIL